MPKAEPLRQFRLDAMPARYQIAITSRPPKKQLTNAEKTLIGLLPHLLRRTDYGYQTPNMRAPAILRGMNGLAPTG